MYVLQMLVYVSAHQNAVFEVLYAYLFRHRREVFGVSDVTLWERHAAVGPLFYRLLFGFFWLSAYETWSCIMRGI